MTKAAHQSGETCFTVKDELLKHKGHPQGITEVTEGRKLRRQYKSVKINEKMFLGGSEK